MKKICFYEGLYEFFSKTVIDPEFNYKNFIHTKLSQRSSFRVKHERIWCKVCDQDHNEIERYSYDKETDKLLLHTQENGVFTHKEIGLIIN